MAKKFSVIHEEVIDVFHEIFSHSHNRKMSFHLAKVIIFGSMICGKTGFFP